MIVYPCIPCPATPILTLFCLLFLTHHTIITTRIIKPTIPPVIAPAMVPPTEELPQE